MKNCKTVKMAFYIFISFCCLCDFAWAGVRINKPKVFLNIAPGSYDSGEIQVDNNGDEAVEVKAYLEDWIYKAQNGEKEFMPKATAPLSCSNWISFYPADFTIAVGGTQVVRYTVTVPKEAEGGHFSVLFFETGGGEMEKLDENGNVATVKVLNRLGSLFYVEPEGKVKKTAEINNIDISQNLNKLTLTFDFLNTGNTYITAKGTFNIMDSQGYVYARGELEEVFTQPKDKAQFRALVPTTNLGTGNYDMLVNLDYENGGTLITEVSFSVEPSGAVTSLKIK